MKSSILKLLRKITGSTSQKPKNSKASWYGILGKISLALNLTFLGASRGSLALTCLLQELVDYYQGHSLKESFKQLDTTLKYPYKSRERSASRTLVRSPGKGCLRLLGVTDQVESLQRSPPFAPTSQRLNPHQLVDLRLARDLAASREAPQRKDSCYGDGTPRPPNPSKPPPGPHAFPPSRAMGPV